MKLQQLFLCSAAVLAALSIAGCDGLSRKQAGTESSPGAAGAVAGGIDLATGIPPEAIEGTPEPVRMSNLEPILESAPTIQVPEGSVLLSKGKPVTASDNFPNIGELAYVTDGDKEPGEGYFVELIDGLQWVQIDLEQEAAIHAVWIWHRQKRAYHDVIVQISNDPEFASGVTTIFNNDFDDSAGLGKGGNQPYVETRFGKLIPAQGIKGRYVRLYSAGNTSSDMNHYIEVEVFGVPAG